MVSHCLCVVLSFVRSQWDLLKQLLYLYYLLLCFYYLVWLPHLIQWQVIQPFNLLKGNDRNTRTRCEICSKLTIKTPERRRAFIFNFEHVLAGWIFPRYYALREMNIFLTMIYCRVFLKTVPFKFRKLMIGLGTYLSKYHVYHYDLDIVVV